MSDPPQAPWPPRVGDRVNVPSAESVGEVVEVKGDGDRRRFVVELDLGAPSGAERDPDRSDPGANRVPYALEELEPLIGQ